MICDHCKENKAFCREYCVKCGKHLCSECQRFCDNDCYCPEHEIRKYHVTARFILYERIVHELNNIEIEAAPEIDEADIKEKLYDLWIKGKIDPYHQGFEIQRDEDVDTDSEIESIIEFTDITKKRSTNPNQTNLF